MKLTKLLTATLLGVNTIASHNLWANHWERGLNSNSYSSYLSLKKMTEERTVDVKTLAIPQGSECISDFGALVLEMEWSESELDSNNGNLGVGSGLLFSGTSFQGAKYNGSAVTRFNGLTVSELTATGMFTSMALFAYALHLLERKTRARTVQAVAEAYELVPTSSMTERLAENYGMSDEEVKTKIRQMNEEGQLCKIEKVVDPQGHWESLTVPAVRELFVPVAFHKIEF